MAGEISAKRHAQAFFQIALKKEQLKEWAVDLQSMAAYFENPELSAILEDPGVHFDKKAALIKGCLPAADDLLMNLAYLLIARGRTRILGQLVKEYVRLVDEKEGLLHAEVVTATPMDSNTEKSILQFLSRTTGKRIAISTRVAPEIIGGYIARVGDRLIDGSVRSNLEAMKNKITEKY